MVAKFVAEEGILRGLILPLKDRDRWIIGRNPDTCQLLIEDPSAADQHLLCQLTPKGILVQNLSSSNPIYINNEEIEKPMVLNNGDRVKIGGSTYRFQTDLNAKESLNGEKPEEEAGSEEDEFIEDTPEEEIINEVEQEEVEVHNLTSPEEEAIEEVEAEGPEIHGLEQVEEETEADEDTVFDEVIAEDEDILAEINFDSAETGHWLLKVIGGPNNGAEFALNPSSTYILGSDPHSCDIVFHDNSVSRQHARLTTQSEQDNFSIEDLKSRNGITLDGESLTEKKAMDCNVLVTMGTTSFIIFEREGEMKTIFSPFLPSIVKSLQQEKLKEDAEIEEEPEPVMTATQPLPPQHEENMPTKLGGFILVGILTGLFIIVGITTTALFRSEPVPIHEVANQEEIIANAVKPFHDVQYFYNKSTGNLQLVGHVLTLADKRQLLYNLEGLPFIKHLDDRGIVIDELVWKIQNQVLSENKSWKGITIHSPQPGKYVLSGYLKTRREAENLSDYISSNFPYIDRLDRRIIVEEDVLSTIRTDLTTHAMPNVEVQMADGILTFRGSLSPQKMQEFQKMKEKFSEIPGIRSIRTFISEVKRDTSLVNITNRYFVTGMSRTGSTISVVINGKILNIGDVLDGMTITDIHPNSIFLEKDGIRYQIDYSA